MSNKISKQDIFNELHKILIDALMVDPALIIPEAKIFDDLGAESIDIVDIRFQVEHSLGIKINQEEMIKSLGENLDAYDIMEKFTVGWLSDYIENKIKNP